jgi:exodeoxyribonuclease X
MKIIRCIDVETTSGKEPPDAAICEIGWHDVVMTEAGEGTWAPSLRAGSGVARLVSGDMEIEPDARAVHHISNADLAGAATLDQLLPELLQGADFLAAHSSAYEKKFLGHLTGAKVWLCTLKAARRVWPDAPSHSLQVLRYWRGLAEGDAGTWPPHRAGPDSYVGALLLVDLINSGATVRDMVAWERQPSLLPGPIRFGKHRGTPWRDLPSDYLDWIVNKSDMDDDAKFTASHWLKEMVA